MKKHGAVEMKETQYIPEFKNGKLRWRNKKVNTDRQSAGIFKKMYKGKDIENKIVKSIMVKSQNMINEFLAWLGNESIPVEVKGDRKEVRMIATVPIGDDPIIVYFRDDNVVVKSIGNQIISEIMQQITDSVEGKIGIVPFMESNDDKYLKGMVS